MEVTVGKEAKGGPAVERIRKILDHIPGLRDALAPVDTVPELTALIQAVIGYVVDADGLDQNCVNTALRNVTAAAKKASS